MQCYIRLPAHPLSACSPHTGLEGGGGVRLLNKGGEEKEEGGKAEVGPSREESVVLFEVA